MQRKLIPLEERLCTWLIMRPMRAPMMKRVKTEMINCRVILGKEKNQTMRRSLRTRNRRRRMQLNQRRGRLLKGKKRRRRVQGTQPSHNTSALLENSQMSFLDTQKEESSTLVVNNLPSGQSKCIGNQGLRSKMHSSVSILTLCQQNLFAHSSTFLMRLWQVCKFRKNIMH